MSQTKNLNNLSELVDLVLDREMSTLSALSTKVDTVTAEITQLDNALDALVVQRAHQDDQLVSGHDFEWQHWRRKTKVDLNVKLAAIRAEQEAQLILTRKAFGRAQAISDLIAKSKI